MQNQELKECEIDNNCQDDSCIGEYCNDQLQSCIGGKSDTLSCPAIGECLINCNGVAACEVTCNRASPEVEMEAEALATCAMNENCADIDCTEMVCPDEWGACFSGDLLCADLWACMLGCEGAELCEYNCITEGTFADQVVLDALMQCTTDNQCFDQPCIDMNCAIEAMACGL
jgi:hypothetical protein